MSTKAYFENIQSVLLENLQTAKKSLYIAVAWITDKDIIRTLAQKAKQGVRVQVLITDDDINSRTDFSALEEAKGKVWRVGKQQEGQDTLMHNKFCVIDSHTVITGSYNWTWKAQNHFENITITDEEPALASQFIAEFEKIKRSFLEIEILTTIDKQSILQRVEILKNVLLLQDVEDINHQCIKLRKLLPHALPADLVKVEKIAQNAHKGAYKETLALIEEYLQENTHIIAVESDLFTLNIQLKNLPTAINNEQEAKEIENIVQNICKNHKTALDVQIQALTTKQQVQIASKKNADMLWWESLDTIWRDIFYVHAFFWKSGKHIPTENFKSIIEIYNEHTKENIFRPSIEDIIYTIDNLTVWDITLHKYITDYRHLRKIKKITDLNIHTLSGVSINDPKVDYSFLLDLKDLNSLSIWDASNIDAIYLNNLRKLKTLWLYGTSVSNTSYLSNLVNLEYLSHSYPMEDVSFLRNLKKIKILTLPLDDTDLSHILELKNLEDLDIRNIYNFDCEYNFSLLKQMNQLKKLHILGHNAIDYNFSFFNHLTELTDLDVSFGNFDISILSVLKKLVL